MEMPSDWLPDGIGELEDWEAEREALGQLLEAAADGFLVLDETGAIQFVDERVQSLLNAEGGTLLGRPVVEILATESAANGAFDVTTGAALQAVITEVISTDKTESSVRVPLQVSDGPIVVVSLTIVSLELSFGSGIGCLVNVDEPRDTEQFRQHRTVVQSVADPIYVVDDVGNVRQVNDAMVEYTGYDREELLGRSVSELIPAGEYESVTETLQAAVDGGDDQAVETLETTVVTSDGDLLLTEARVTALTDGDGSYAGSVGVLRDIRERKERERDLELLKEVLTRVFRHNIRNELMIIQGHAETASEDDLACHIDAILETTGRLLDHSEKARLIERVIETDELHEIGLTAIVENAIDRLRSEYPDATIGVELSATAPVVAHPDIGSAIEELVENAIVHASDAPTVDIWTETHGAFRTLYVRDESGGLDDAELDVLREGSESRFEHTSGVGLWLVRWLVEYSEGTLLVHRTAEGTLMGIRFHTATTDDRTWLGRDSPVARVPAKVRELEHMSAGSVVGRTDELHELESHYSATTRTGGHAVFVSGDVGVGKSTLVEEFRTRLAAADESPLVARGHCVQDVMPPYHVVRQVLKELSVDADQQTLLADVTRGIDDDPEAVRDRRQALFADIAARIREIATTQPVVLILEDIHWADRTTVALLEYLLEEVGRWALPVLFVGTYRNGAVDADHPLAPVLDRVDERGREHLLELEPLDVDDVALLLEDVLDAAELPDAFVEAVHDHTGGSPLFVGAIGQHIAGRLEAGGLPDDPTAISLPASVESTVVDRLDDLNEPARELLELGAVAGDRASLDVLLAASTRPTAALLETVDTLIEAGLWSRHDGEIRFVHGLVRDAALAAIDESRRQRLHERAATAIEDVHAEAITDHCGRLATHYHEAGELDRAVDYYQRAGDQSMELYAHERALDQYRTGRALAEEVGDEQALVALTEKVADVSLTVGEYDDVETHIQFLREQTDETETERQQHIALLEAKKARMQGELDAAIEAAQAGIELDPSPSELHCRLLEQKGSAERQQSRYDQARETARTQLELASELDNTRMEGSGYRKLGVITKNEGEYDRAANYQQEALERFQAVDDRKNIASVHTHLGVIADMQGVYDEAVHHYRQAREMYDEMSHRQNRAYVQTNLGAVAMERSDYERAEEAFADALDTLIELGDVHALGTTRLNLGELTRKRGEFTRSREYYRAALADLQEVGDRHTVAMVREGLATTAMKQGDYERATREAEAAREVYEDINNETDIARVLTALGTIARRQGENERARTLLADAVAAFEAVGDDHRIATPRLELARLDRREGKLAGAAERVDDAAATAEEVDDDSLAAECHVERGRLACERGECEAAREHLETAHERYREIDDIHGVATVRFQQGQLAHDEGRAERARDLFEQALETFADSDAFEDALRTLDALVETCQELDDTEEVRRCRDRATTILADAPEPLRHRYDHLADDANREDRQ